MVGFLPSVREKNFSPKFLNGPVAHYGCFMVLEKPRQIKHTWVSEATRGMESIVTLSFEPVDGKTHVHVNHANRPDDEGGRLHERAWGYVLGQMSSRFKQWGIK